MIEATIKVRDMIEAPFNTFHFVNSNTRSRLRMFSFFSRSFSGGGLTRKRS
jgi:hypothetical protein